MRVIVALLKLFVGTSFLLSAVGFSFLFGASFGGFFGDGWTPALGGVGLLAAIIGFIVLVLYTGLVALLISGHDRMAEIASLLRERNDMLYLERGQSPRE
jgi:hypothetical protein